MAKAPASAAAAGQTLYQLLGVDDGASESRIHKAFLLLSREHHPDKGGDTAFFQRLKEADTVLAEPDSRKAYDRKLGARKPRFLSDMRVTPAELEAGAAEIPGYPGASLRFRPGQPTPFTAKIPGLVPQSNTCDGSGSVTVRLEAQLEVQIGGSAPVRAQVHRVDANSLLNLGRCGAGLAALAKLSEEGLLPQDAKAKLDELYGRGYDLLASVTVPLDVQLCGTDALHIQMLEASARHQLLTLSAGPAEIQPGVPTVLDGFGLLRPDGSYGSLVLEYEIEVPASAADGILANIPKFEALQAAPQQLQDSRTEAAQLKEAARLNDAELEGICQRQADSSPVGAAIGNLVTAVGSSWFGIKDAEKGKSRRPSHGSKAGALPPSKEQEVHNSSSSSSPIAKIGAMLDARTEECKRLRLQRSQVEEELQAQLCRAAQEQQDLENRAAQERQAHAVALQDETRRAAQELQEQEHRTAQERQANANHVFGLEQDYLRHEQQQQQQHRIELRKEQDAAAEAAVQSAAKIAELEQRLSSALKMQTVVSATPRSRMDPNVVALTAVSRTTTVEVLRAILQPSCGELRPAAADRGGTVIRLADCRSVDGRKSLDNRNQGRTPDLAALRPSTNRKPSAVSTEPVFVARGRDAGGRDPGNVGKPAQSAPAVKATVTGPAAGNKSWLPK